MRYISGKISLSLVAASLVILSVSSAQSQAPARSSVVIPLKKEKAPASKVVTIHDTVTMVRVDTVRIVQTVVHTDTVFKVDTLRDSCSRALVPIPIPIPLPLDHGHDQPATLDPIPATSVAPEPETFALVGTGLAALIGLARFRRKK